MPFDPAVFALFRAGVAGIAGVVDGWTDSDWARRACGAWTGTDVAGHLVNVITWYHDWLDRGIAGDRTPPFGIEELDRATASSLAALPAGTGPERVAEFCHGADAYATRLVEHWDTPFAYPRGEVTAGLHCALAAWEWHLHAWDLASGSTEKYRPDNSAVLYHRGMDCYAAATGADPRVVEVPDPWLELLRRTGRAS